MRNLNTFVCAGLIAISVCCAAIAQSASPQDGTLHPVLGKRPPRELLNSDILALPARERQAWIHGAIALTSHALISKNERGAKCLLEWYFEVGNGAELIPEALRTFPDKPPTSTILAVARRACPQL